ncbi:hypothetical protein OROMI_012611 [Orobanche minor]
MQVYWLKEVPGSNSVRKVVPKASSERLSWNLISYISGDPSFSAHQIYGRKRVISFEATLLPLIKLREKCKNDSDLINAKRTGNH